MEDFFFLFEEEVERYLNLLFLLSPHLRLRRRSTKVKDKKKYENVSTADFN